MPKFNKKTKNLFGERQNQSGFSLLLSVLIMSSLTIMTLAVSDVVFRVGLSSRKIGQSEVAYYSAETAIEKALYQIERDKSIFGLDGQNGSLADIDNALWSSNVSEILAPIDPYTVNLNEGESFQLDFDFNGLTIPSSLDINCSQSARVVILSNDGQTTQNCPLAALDVSGVILRVINEYAGTNSISFSADGGSLPLGIQVTGIGTYQNQKRVIEVERKNWQIY